MIPKNTFQILNLSFFIALITVCGNQVEAQSSAPTVKWQYNSNNLEAQKNIIKLGNLGSVALTYGDNVLPSGGNLNAAYTLFDPQFWSMSSLPSYASSLQGGLNVGSSNPDYCDAAKGGSGFTCCLTSSAASNPLGWSDVSLSCKNSSDPSNLATSWSYNFPGSVPHQLYEGTKISRDGSIIVAARGLTGFGYEVKVFNSNSPVPFRTFAATSTANGALLRVQLSEDGSKILLVFATRILAFDVQSSAPLLNELSSAQILSSSISPDGEFLAWGGMGYILMYKYDTLSHSYVFHHYYSLTQPLNRVLFYQTLSISKNGPLGHVLVAGRNEDDYSSTTSEPVRVQAVSLESLAPGQVSYDNLPWLVNKEYLTTQNGIQTNSVASAISSDGLRFAVGNWGDQLGLMPEVLVFRTNQPSAAAFSLNMPGSVMDLDISESGKDIVVLTKKTHANSFGSGNTITGITLDRDLEIERTGLSSFNITVYGQPNSRASFFYSPALANIPDTSTSGTRYLRRSDMQRVSLGIIGSSGKITASFSMPTNISIGGALYVQGRKSLGGSTLWSEDYGVLIKK